MRSQENLLCQWFEQLWNQGDAQAIDRLGAPTLQAHGADGVTRTQEEFRAWYTVMRAAIPDLRVRIEQCVDTGSIVAVHWAASGTHSGTTDALGPATGRRISMSGMSVARVENGLLVEGWDDYDYAGLLAQMGAGV